MSRKNLIVTVAIVFAVVGALLLPKTLAATATIYFNPTTVSVQNGNNVSLVARANVSASTTLIENLVITYDATKLQFVSLNDGGTVYPATLFNNTTSGSITLDRGAQVGSPVTGDGVITTFIFKALAGSGSTNVAISGKAFTSEGYTPVSNGSAAINFTTPPSPPPPSPSPTPSPSPSPTPTPSPSPSPTPSPNPGSSPGPSPSPTPTPTPISQPPESTPVVEEKEVQYTKAKFSVTTPEPVVVYLEYGISNLSLVTKQTSLGTNHEVALDPANLVPGTTYQYRVVMIDQSGNRTNSEVKMIKTKGFTLKLLITDKNGKPLGKRKVLLRSEPTEAKTDSKGVATFENIAPGEHNIEFVDGKKTFLEGLTVENNVKEDGEVQTAEIQNVSVVYGDLVLKNSNKTIILAIVGLVVVGAIALMVLKKKGSGGGPKMSVAGTGMTTPVPPSSVSSNESQSSSDDESELMHKVSGVSNPAPGATLGPNGEKLNP